MKPWPGEGPRQNGYGLEILNGCGWACVDRWVGGVSLVIKVGPKKKKKKNTGSQKNKNDWNCVMCGKVDTRTTNLRRH